MMREALKLGIPVDTRRRSVHERNIEALKQIARPTPTREKKTRMGVKAPAEARKRARGREQAGAEKPRAPRRRGRSKEAGESPAGSNSEG